MLIWWALRIWTAVYEPEQIFQCDPIDGPKLAWSKEQRKAARELAVIEWRRKGAKGAALAYIDSVSVREGSGAPSRWHDGGIGLGLHGQNVRYYGEGVNLCDPRESSRRVWKTVKSAIEKRGAKTWWDVQAVYAGRFECASDYRGPKTCTGEQQDRTTSAICDRMSQRGHSCYAEAKL